MGEIIVSLQNLGGNLSRKDLWQDIRDNSEVVPAEYMDLFKTSVNSGRKYKPAAYQFNFALKHLNYADYVTSPSRGVWELTEKGRKVEVSTFNPDQEVRPLSDKIFAEKSKKKQVQMDKKTPIENIETPKEDSWRLELSEALMSMSPKRFELFARRLVKSMGVEIDPEVGITFVNDGGLDGFGYIQSGDFRTARVAIQAKRWTANIQSPEIDKFRGAMDKYNAEFGIFITTSDFSKGAINASRIGTRVITLINGEDIADIVADKKLYVKEVITYELEDFYYEED